MNYLLSFTVMSLNFYEAQEIAKVYLKHLEWEETKNIILSENILQRKTLSSSKRVFREIENRLKTLTNEEIEYLVSNESDSKYIATLSCFKLYRIIYDFAIEVIFDKFKKGDLKLLNSDFEVFLESKKLFFDNLKTITPSTEYKIKQVMFKIFKESDILTHNKTISKPFLSKNLAKIIKNDDPNYLYGFLFTKDEIERV